MKYMLTIIGEETDWSEVSPEQAKAAMAGWDAYTSELREAGAFVAGEGLQPSATATTVKLRGDEEPITVDGPFAETKEQLGGFYLLECGDLDEALAWARKIPMPGGTVEVRPVMDYEAAGSELHSNAAEAAR